jgi:hypothetical protein
MSDEQATDDVPAAPPGLLSGMSRRNRLILGWGLLLVLVVLFAILALV